MTTTQRQSSAPSSKGAGRLNNYDRRWLHAFNWAKKLKALFDTGEYLMESDGEFLSPREFEIAINEQERTIRIKNGKQSKCSVSYIIYDGNLDFDHGAYTPVSEFKRTIIDTTRLYKMVPVEL